MKSLIITLLCSTLTFPAFAHGPSNIQIQGQSQGQRQSQGQSQYLSNSIRNSNTNYNANYNLNKNSATARSSATGGASSNVIGINTGTNTPWYGYGNSIAIAPSGTQSACTNTTSFGAGFIGSLSFGIPTPDHSCNLRANYATFKIPAAVQRKLMCEDRYMNAAFTAAGYNDCTNVTVIH